LEASNAGARARNGARIWDGPDTCATGVRPTRAARLGRSATDPNATTNSTANRSYENDASKDVSGKPLEGRVLTDGVAGMDGHASVGHTEARR
jgi:hypothetical protein